MGIKQKLRNKQFIIKYWYTLISSWYDLYRIWLHWWKFIL